MADPQARFEPLDPGRIDGQSDEELHYWSRELHCPKDQLLDAVGHVGNHVTAVRDYLESHRGAPSRPRGGSAPPGAA
jgi:hypothetical protein